MRWTVAAAMTVACFVAEGALASEVATRTLKAWLGDAVRSSRTEGTVSLEYCPDNTCERLVSTRPSLSSEFEDFGLLYLATRSEYVYLKDERPKQVAEAVQKVLLRYGGKCDDAASSECLVAVLRLLQTRTRASLSFVRFDEGYRCVVPQPLLGMRAVGKSRCVKVAGEA